MTGLPIDCVASYQLGDWKEHFNQGSDFGEQAPGSILCRFFGGYKYIATFVDRSPHRLCCFLPVGPGRNLGLDFGEQAPGTRSRP